LQRYKLCIEHGRTSFRIIFVNSISNKKFLTYLSVYFTNQLTDLWASLYFQHAIKIELFHTRRLTLSRPVIQVHHTRRTNTGLYLKIKS
jgi:hypothetical protein